ncbi:MAG: DUF1501 domain-containing protein [Pirellulaceae bacterium]|nr:DUF1501 domain-containing protein [Pirellulaceae bacterium]
MTIQFPCGRVSPTCSRRQWLVRSACGFGALALTALSRDRAFAGSFFPEDGPQNPLTPRAPHYPPKVKRIVYLYMDGGPSQVDTFDPKPLLTKESGEPFKMKMEPTQFNNNGNTLGSPWKFNQYGECGTPVSDLFPNIARHVDKMCVIRSMYSNFSEHTNANYFLHTGNGFQGRPSMGAWICYGLGSENQNLPGFVVLNGGLIPPGGLDCFNSGFLPASYQGSVFNAGDTPLANIRRNEASEIVQRRKLDLLAQLDSANLQRAGTEGQIEAAIANYELAFRMQATVPEVADISDETEQTKEMYGLNAEYKHTKVYGRQCLLARRLLERGVRFIEVTCPNTGHDRWDQHGNLKQGHSDNARAIDQPIAALLTDLDQRGLLEDTLVVWSGEFGRTPFAQGSDGRDHNPFGFSLWMAGGGIKGGTVYGATDEYGYKAIENKVEIHDLHATMLHLLGMDHERLTFHWSGRDMRLTDVKGKLIHGILA